MSVLILGGAGYIGSRLALFLKEGAFNVTVVDHDYPDVLGFLKARGVSVFNASVDAFLESKKERDSIKSFDSVVLLAGNSSVRSSENNASTMENNVGAFMKVVNALRADQKLIYASSSSVYGDTKQQEVCEEYREYKGHNFYDISKKVVDLMAERSSLTRPIFGLRFGTVCGWSPNFRNDVMINAMVDSALSDGVVRMYVQSVRRPVLGLRDLCRAVSLILRVGGNSNSGIYNLASVQTDVETYATRVAEVLKCRLEKCEPQPQGNEKLMKTTYDFSMSCAKFLSAFPGFRFEETIESIVEEIVGAWDLTLYRSPRLKDRYSELVKLTNIVEVKECRCCGSPDLREVLNLGKQPLANDFKARGQADSQEKSGFVFSLSTLAYHLTHVVPPQVMFSNYLYVSGTSASLADYFKWFASSVSSFVVEAGLTPRVLRNPVVNKGASAPSFSVLDIGANDGSQLREFARLGWTTIGVDPALNLNMRGVDRSVSSFWSPSVALSLKKEFESVDVIVAQNVFGHVHDCVEFLSSCRLLMHKDSFLFIQTSQADMVLKGEFDTIYHEHLSFFSVHSMSELLKRTGMHLRGVCKVPIHGTSFMFCVQVPRGEQKVRRLSQSRVPKGERVEEEGGRTIQASKVWSEAHESERRENGRTPPLGKVSVGARVGRQSRSPSGLSSSVLSLPSLDSSVKSFLVEEQVCGLTRMDTYFSFAHLAKTRSNCFKTQLRKWWVEGKKMIGFGAAAKGMVLLNFANITDELEFCVDENPLKWGRLCPGTHIQIFGIEKLKELNDEKVVVVVLAWNFLEEIRRKVQQVRPPSKFEDIFYSFQDTLENSKL